MSQPEADEPAELLSDATIGASFRPTEWVSYPAIGAAVYATYSTAYAAHLSTHFIAFQSTQLSI
jgi:hypothetical protein